MPAKDRYHDIVVRALRKDGWTILGEQVDLFIPSRRLWVDIRATKEAQTAIILIEVKGFDTGASPVAYLSDAVGQCIVYRGALAYLGLSDVLYLAVPATALTGILGEEIGRRTVQQAQVGLITFDAVREEIVEWRHYNIP
jgi:hypothetical protein